MNLSDLEKKKLKKISAMILDANKRILALYKKLTNSIDSSLDANSIDIDNMKIDDKKLIQLIKYRNELREKYKGIAGRIWEEKFDEENYEKI